MPELDIRILLTLPWAPSGESDEESWGPDQVLLLNCGARLTCRGMNDKVGPGERSPSYLIPSVTSPPPQVGRARLPGDSQSGARTSASLCVGYPRTSHRQAELQVLLCHEQQISIQGARHRHCSGCRAPARPLRPRPFFDPGAKFPLRQSRGPETEAGPEVHGPDSILGSGRGPDWVCVSGWVGDRVQS